MTYQINLGNLTRYGVIKGRRIFFRGRLGERIRAASYFTKPVVHFSDVPLKLQYRISKIVLSRQAISTDIFEIISNIDTINFRHKQLCCSV